jgi:tetratricopeptide (TPR) repeat protein
MSDIFISYKREDQATARKLADALESEGWTVWWDPKLRAGERFNDVIETALNEAKCVIVLWSKRSVESLYVKDEATHALKRKKLVPVTIQQVELPFRFEELHTPSLFDWDGSKDFSEFRRLVEDISAILGPTPMRRAEGEESPTLDEERLRKQGQPSEEEAKRKDEQESRRTRKYAWRTYGAVAAAVAVMLIIFSFVFWPKLQGATEKVILLVADFGGPDPEKWGVTEEVINQLRRATEKYTDVEIQGLGKAITEQEGSKVAQTEGKKRNATIVLWGWYRIPREVVQLRVHFEVLNPPKEFSALGQAPNVQQRAAIAELTSFELLDRLSKETTYLSLFVLGMARRAAGDGKGAIDRFSDALAKKTEHSSSLNHSIVYFYRGLTYLFKRDSDHALADLNQAIKLQPELAEAYVNRSVIYSAKGDYSRSLADLNQAIQLKPDLTVAYNNRGLLYVQAKDYDQAIDNFSQALKLFVSTDSSKISPPIGSQLGSIKFDRDVPVLNFFVAELSDYMIYINRGAAYLSKGDHDRALKDFNHAIKLRPNQPLTYANRATVYFAKQDYDHALDDLNQVIKLQPDFALAYWKRGGVYYLKGDYDRALADLNQAIKLQPNSADLYSSRGELYAKRDEHDRAIADFSQEIKLRAPDSPDSIEAYLLRGISYGEKRDYDHAIADFNQALKLEPDNARAYNSRGWTYAQKGDFDRALDDLNQALKLKPAGAAIYDSRGFAYAAKGDYDRAMADYNQALKLKPDADYAYYGRGVLYRTLGEHQKAIADFKRTLELTKKPKRQQDAEKQLRELGAR